MEVYMKYGMSTALVLGALIVSPFAALRADEPSAPGMQTKEHKGRNEKLHKKLGLSEEQSAKLKSIRESQKSTLTPLRDKERDLVKKLKSQVEAKAADSDIQATLDEIKTTRKSMGEQMEQFQSQKEQVLTPTQRAKMLLHRMNKPHEKGHEESGEK
jgi:Spy/CpxP family protein refolding chaperone